MDLYSDTNMVTVRMNLYSDTKIVKNVVYSYTKMAKNEFVFRH